MGERGAERSGNGEIGGARARGKRRAGGEEGGAVDTPTAGEI